MKRSVNLENKYLAWFTASMLLGNIYFIDCQYANAQNKGGTENLKFQISPYVRPNGDNTNVNQPDKDETNDDTSTVVSESDPAASEAKAPEVSEAEGSETEISETQMAEAPVPGIQMPETKAVGAAAEISVSETPAVNTPISSAPITSSSKLLQGQVVYTVPSGTPIKLKLASVPSHPMKMMDRDLDGNLYPARVGQVITARTTEDIYIEKNRVIPEGTIFSGEVSRILPPRRVGRPGSLELSFNELITPDGRKFAFKAEADNHRDSTVKTKAKGFGIIAYHAAGGAIVGAIVAYQICGLQNTIAMHGYNVAAGAAAGALIATGFAIMRKGPKATLEPGDDLNMTINNDLLMPEATTPVRKKILVDQPGLKIEVEKSKIVKDGLGSNFITVDATITNDSDNDLSSMDLFLEDTNKDRHPLAQSPDEDSQFLFHLEPHSTQHLHLSFLTPFPKLKQHLVWLDHETRIVLAAQSL